MGQPCAVKTSSTTHGGTPISSAARAKAGGSLVIRKGDTIACPSPGHGTTTITQGSSSVKAEDKEVAYNGCTTSCGATIINGVTSVLVG
jgi:uncharacterized Zn-binding protein involved in type VI secretion